MALLALHDRQHVRGLAVGGVWLTLALSAGACGERVRPGAGDAGMQDVGTDATTPAFVNRILTVPEFAALAGEEWSVKYLGAVAGKSVPPALSSPCVFQNTAQQPLHLGFLKTIAEYKDLDFATYLALTQKRSSRVLWAGELKLLPGARHPRSGARGVLVYFVFADDSEALTLDELAEMQTRLAGCVPFAREQLALLAMSPAQEAGFLAQKAALAERGVDVVRALDVLPALGAEGLSPGEGYGYLRVVRAGAPMPEVGLRDIVVAASVPAELGLVAGLVTTLPQNVHSHLNLRLREKHIPNARVPDILSDASLNALDGRLAHLVVAGDDVRLTPATLADAEEFWRTRRPALPPLEGDLAETRVRPLGELRATERKAFGVKAANLGELHALLPAPHRPEGFALPFALGRRFLDDSGLGARIDAFLADPRAATDATYRRAGWKNLREAIEKTPKPAALIEAVAAAASAAVGPAYATTPIKFRSSSNVEDGTLASGAGLYDSARGCFADDSDEDQLGPSRCLGEAERSILEDALARRRAELAAHPERSWLIAMIDDLESDLTKERTVARALGKVWASLWNDRAFEERAYYGLDHRQALMGVAANPSFVNERLDAVAVTNLGAAGELPLYRVVSQKDGLPVVRPPDPTAVAETLTFRRGPMDAITDPHLVTMSSLATGPLWTDEQRDTLARLLFVVQDHFAARIYPQMTRLKLDLEVKLDAEGRVVIKQVRPYIEVGP